MKKLIQTYKTIPKIPLNLSRRQNLANQSVFLETPIFNQDVLNAEVREKYIFIEVADQCNRPAIWPVLQYSSLGPPVLDYSRRLKVNTDKDTEQKFFMFAAFHVGIDKANNNSIKFTGIKVSTEEVACIGNIYEIPQGENTPLLLTVLPGDFKHLFQRFLFELTENPIPEFRSLNFKAAEDKSAGRENISTGELSFHSKILREKDYGFQIHGYAQNECGEDLCNRPNYCKKNMSIAAVAYPVASVCQNLEDILVTKEKALVAGSVLYSKGHVYSGAIQYVLLEAGKIVDIKEISKPGNFEFVMKIPRSGKYVLGIIHNLDFYTSLESRINIEKMQWIRSL